MSPRGEALPWHCGHHHVQVPVQERLAQDYPPKFSVSQSEPVVLPKGTRLLAVSHFDNSPNNRFNPDPNAEVHWGLQSYNEMSLIYFGLIIGREAVPQKVFSALAVKTNFE